VSIPVEKSMKAGVCDKLVKEREVCGFVAHAEGCGVTATLAPSSPFFAFLHIELKLIVKACFCVIF